MGRSFGHEFNVKKVKRLMLEQGLNHEDMAFKVGVARSQLSSVLKLGRCRETMLFNMAAALGVEIADILPKEEPEVGKIKVMLDPGAKMPTRAHETDAGLDLYSPYEFMLPQSSASGEETLDGFLAKVGCRTVDTGVHIEIPSGYVGMIKSKSGLNVKHGIISEGVIDSGYTGSICVKLYNLGNEEVLIEEGQKISQLVLLPIITPAMELVDSLEDTERGAGGFGSTGKF